MSGFLGQQTKAGEVCWDPGDDLGLDSVNLGTLTIPTIIESGDLDVFSEELGCYTLRCFSCDLLLKFHESFASVEFRTRRATAPLKYTKLSYQFRVDQNENEVIGDLLFKGSELFSISWLRISNPKQGGRRISEITSRGSQFQGVRLIYTLGISDQSFENSGFLLVGLVRDPLNVTRNCEISLALKSTEIMIHFTKCLLYWLELRFRGWAPPSMIHHGTGPLRMLPLLLGRLFLRELLEIKRDIWRKPVKNLGILGIGDAGDLTIHNATIATDHLSRIFESGLLGFQWALKFKESRKPSSGWVIRTEKKGEFLSVWVITSVWLRKAAEIRQRWWTGFQ
jgi:hypothetical protein